MADTWGIPGPTFLMLFAAAAGVVLVGTLIHRSRLFAGPSQVRVDQLSPQHTAYLNGGPALAVYSSLTFLRQNNVVEVDSGGRGLRRTGGLPAGATPLDAAVLHAAGNGLRAEHLHTERSVAEALAAIGEDLRRGGLAVGPDTLKRARRGPLLLLLLFAVGLVRIIAGLANDRPVLFLVLLTIPVGIVGLVLSLRKPIRTRAANRTLNDARRHYHHLRPSMQPAWSTYGPANAALAVGLFGTAVLWSADPAFAGESGVPEEMRQQGGGYDGGGGTGGGCGSSSGGDSGGGSSCGGGGGCGGGGCGG